MSQRRRFTAQERRLRTAALAAADKLTQVQAIVNAVRRSICTLQVPEEEPLTNRAAKVAAVLEELETITLQATLARDSLRRSCA